MTQTEQKTEQKPGNLASLDKKVADAQAVEHAAKGGQPQQQAQPVPNNANPAQVQQGAVSSTPSDKS